MTLRLAQPLPECPGCARPIARAQAERTGRVVNGHLVDAVCSACLSAFPEAFARAAVHADRLRLERQAAAIRRRQAEAERVDELARKRAERAARSRRRRA